jgi:hypothetical protein
MYKPVPEHFEPEANAASRQMNHVSPRKRAISREIAHTL